MGSFIYVLNFSPPFEYFHFQDKYFIQKSILIQRKLQLLLRLLTLGEDVSVFYFSAQGKGIFLINRLSQLKKWSKDSRGTP